MEVDKRPTTIPICRSVSGSVNGSVGGTGRRGGRITAMLPSGEMSPSWPMMEEIDGFPKVHSRYNQLRRARHGEGLSMNPFSGAEDP